MEELQFVFSELFELIVLLTGRGTFRTKGRVAFTLKNVICDTPFSCYKNIVLLFLL